MLDKPCGRRMALRYSAKDGERYYCCPRVPYCTGRLAVDTNNPGDEDSAEVVESRPTHLDFSLPAKWLKFKLAGLKELAKQRAEEEAAKQKGKKVPKEKAPKFKVLTVNRYPKELAQFRGLIDEKKNDDEIQRCTCDPEDGGCGDDCVNRLLFTECTIGYCRCGPAADEGGDTGACANTVFQRGAFPKVEPWKTVDKGWGLRVLVGRPLT
jgi:hypothetical protein